MTSTTRSLDIGTIDLDDARLIRLALRQLALDLEDYQQIGTPDLDLAVEEASALLQRAANLQAWVDVRIRLAERQAPVGAPHPGDGPGAPAGIPSFVGSRRSIHPRPEPTRAQLDAVVRLQLDVGESTIHPGGRVRVHPEDPRKPQAWINRDGTVEPLTPEELRAERPSTVSGGLRRALIEEPPPAVLQRARDAFHSGQDAIETLDQLDDPAAGPAPCFHCATGTALPGRLLCQACTEQLAEQLAADGRRAEAEHVHLFDAREASDSGTDDGTDLEPLA